MMHNRYAFLNSPGCSYLAHPVPDLVAFANTSTFLQIGPTVLKSLITCPQRSARRQWSVLHNSTSWSPTSLPGFAARRTSEIFPTVVVLDWFICRRLKTRVRKSVLLSVCLKDLVLLTILLSITTMFSCYKNINFEAKECGLFLIISSGRVLWLPHPCLCSCQLCLCGQSGAAVWDKCRNYVVMLKHS